MGEAQYADWMARGRNHQWSKRPLDALQCFRRAMREWPRGSEARFHLGETLWQLGHLDEALRAWQDVTRTDPAFLAAWQALAEGALGTGDARTAAAAAGQVLARAPADARAHAVRAIAGHGDATTPAAQREAALVAALKEAAWLGIPALGGSLALALDTAPPGELIDRIAAGASDAGVAERLHPRLLALICERVAERGAAGDDEQWFSRMLARTLSPDDHEALRRSARAAFHAHAQAAEGLARAYAGLCTTAFGPGIPLLWPRRTAGARVRVVLLGRSADVAALADALCALACDVTLASFGGVQAMPLPVMPLAPVPGIDDARRVAALDADVLIDCAGLEAATGVLLAQRPARRIVGLRGAGAPNAVPLIDALASTEDVIAELRAWRAPAAPAQDAATLAQVWEGAVAAHQRGDRAEAEAGYARVLEWQPEHAPASYLQGMAARERGDAALARAKFAQAPRRRRRHRRAWRDNRSRPSSPR